MVFLLKDEKDADRLACFQRPPKKYTSKDEPWVSNKALRPMIAYSGPFL